MKFSNRGFTLTELLLIVAIGGASMFAASHLTVSLAKSLKSEDMEMLANQEISRLDILLADPAACTINFKSVNMAKLDSELPTFFKAVDTASLDPNDVLVAEKINNGSIIFGSKNQGQPLVIKRATLTSDDINDLRYLNITFAEQINPKRTYIRKLPLHIKTNAGGALEVCSSMPMISTQTTTCPTLPSPVVRCSTNSPRVHVTKNISFPNVTGCSFGMNGNLPAIRNHHANAREEVYQSLNLPTGAEVCNIAFKFNADKLVYDDEFYFTFNNIILAASAGPSVSQFLPTRGGLYLWDWNSLKGQKAVLPGGSGSRYCIPSPEAAAKIAPLKDEFTTATKARKTAILSEIAKIQTAEENICTWPKTQSKGTIFMRLSPGTFSEIFTTNPTGTGSFGMITIGNGHSYDCAQSGISFSADIEYVQ